ncbi:BETA-GLUCOSIDASE 44 [Salix koriyanagi]|uniref:BETA-GLUCOSIDASE 44 n=1 Tax=Salix koriyanagi TaxID=2511006 RepID=A0A9Q0WG56_9ROSI|nr:BETA-GLUCOSIDASE 44 [Salix koriyanagi]
MRTKALPFLIFCLSIIQCISHAAGSNGASEQPETVRFETAGELRHSFPKGFVFGTATSAYQVEGMADKDGRGPSIWDEFVKIPGIVANNATGEVAVDQYHRYKVDGTGKVNWNGVAYYNRLINYMIEKGITPYANLYHYDLPLALEKKYKGLLSYQEKQKGRIGILLDFVYYEPLTRSKADNLAAQRARDFHIGWFIHPIVYGEYPKTMQNIVGNRLPKFTKEEVKMVKGSMDFVGINQYTTFYMYDPHQPKPKYLGYQQDWNVGFAYKKNGVPIGPRANSNWLYNVPWGMYKAVMYIKERYGNPTIILSENGMDDPGNFTRSKALHDTTRIGYFKAYLTQLKKAADEGANLVGYFAWSLLDNFEWRSGYTSRFGIVYVDYTNLRRYPKISAYWFKKLLERNRD